ncbi:MAG: hypothetical protein ACYDAY_11330 [Candidatus Dormibacteria bacterium]
MRRIVPWVAAATLSLLALGVAPVGASAPLDPLGPLQAERGTWADGCPEGGYWGQAQYLVGWNPAQGDPAAYGYYVIKLAAVIPGAGEAGALAVPFYVDPQHGPDLQDLRDHQSDLGVPLGPAAEAGDVFTWSYLGNVASEPTFSCVCVAVGALVSYTATYQDGDTLVSAGESRPIVLP